MCVCTCVCVCESEIARHTSVIVINLTLASPFENTHTHTRSVSKSELSSCQRLLSPPLPPSLSVKNCFPLASPLSSLLPLVLFLPSPFQSCPLPSSIFFFLFMSLTSLFPPDSLCSFVFLLNILLINFQMFLMFARSKLLYTWCQICSGPERYLLN